MKITFLKMTIGRKLGFAFGTMLLIFLALGLFAMNRMHHAANDAEDISGEHLPLGGHVGHIRLGIAHVRQYIRTYQYTGDRADYDKSLTAMEELKKGCQGVESIVRTNDDLADLKTDLAKFPPLLSAYDQQIVDTEKSWTDLRAVWTSTIKEADEIEAATRALAAHERQAAGDDLSTNAPKAALEKRQAKQNLINEVVLGFYNIRIANLRSQAFRDPKMLEAGLKNTAQLDKSFAALLPLFSRAQDAQSAAEVRKLMDAYRADLEKQSAILKRQEDINIARIKTAVEIEELAQSVAEKSGKQTTDTAVASTREMRHSSNLLVGGVALGVLLGIVASWFLTRLISRPVVQAARVVERVSQRDLTEKLHVSSSDEVGEMGHALNRMVDGLSENVRGIAESAQSLAGASQELSAVSTEVSSNAEETSAQALVVSSAAEQVSKNIQTVATGAEEMTASIGEIAKNAAEASKVAMHAAHVAEKTNGTVTKLGESSNEIGHVIKVITSIAEQTNLLALNATIEAARAGEAGKGFAVVANEVKELAKQTAKATEDIGARIGAIQTDTHAAVEAIQEVGQIVKQINDIQSVIASAVEEQAATTREISKNASEAAQGSTEIARNITSVSEAARSTTQGASQTSSAASELAKLSVELKQIVDQFRLSKTSSPGGASASMPQNNGREMGSAFQTSRSRRGEERELVIASN